MGLFFHIGRYASFMGSVLRRPEQGAVFRKLLVEEMNAIGLQSLGIVALLSVFMGAVICIQTAHQIGGWIHLIFRHFDFWLFVIIIEGPPSPCCRGGGGARAGAGHG